MINIQNRMQTTRKKGASAHGAIAKRPFRHTKMHLADHRRCPCSILTKMTRARQPTKDRRKSAKRINQQVTMPSASFTRQPVRTRHKDTSIGHHPRNRTTTSRKTPTEPNTTTSGVKSSHIQGSFCYVGGPIDHRFEP